MGMCYDMLHPLLYSVGNLSDETNEEVVEATVVR